MGSIFKRGNVFWLKYYHKGRMIRESSGSDKKMVATALLKKREGELAIGKLPSAFYERTMFNDMAELLLADYRINELKSIKRVHTSLNQLVKRFGDDRAVDITSARVKEYITARLVDGVTNATINRELSALKRMFKLARDDGLINDTPVIKTLQERNVRTGFFEHDEYLAIKSALPPYVQGLFTFAYKTGWRFSEIVGLTWSNVDRTAWTVRLEIGDTKNDEARVIFLDDELKRIFKAQWGKSNYVFPNRNGEKIHDFRKSWNTAFKKTGIPRKIFHDLRRTAVRNMIRNGIPEVVAMKISGHRTRAVFDRYNIIDESDIKKACDGLGTKPGTVLKFRKKKAIK